MPPAGVPRCLVVSMLLATCSNLGAESTLVQHVLPSAICADGSPGHFYMAANESSSDIVVYLQGGRGCAHNVTICKDMLAEDPHLFTSEGFPRDTEGYSFLSGNERENGLYYTYSRVYVPYCTMDMYLLDTESSDGRFQFRGRPLLEETLRMLLDAGKNNTRVVFGGSSAGGVGAFNAVPWLLDNFPQVAELSVILDSAFFFDAHGYLEPILKYIQGNPSVAYSSHCAEEFDGGACCMQFGCMLQRGYYPTMESKLRGTFVFSSTQDIIAAIQINQLGTFEENIPESMWSSAVYTGQMKSSLRNVASLYPEALSVFAPSCIDHVLLVSSELDMAPCVPELEAFTDSECEHTCLYDDSRHVTGRRGDGTLDAGLRWQASQSADSWNTLQINGTSLRYAMEQWWEGRSDSSKQVRLFDSCDDPHCNPTCRSSVLPGTREETDGSFSWALVLAASALAIIILGVGISSAVWSYLEWSRVKDIVARRLHSGSKENTSTSRATALSCLRLNSPDGVPGGDLSTTPVLEWRGLSYWLPKKQSWSLPYWSTSKELRPPSEQQLLFSVDGTVPTGALCALMGPSGSGKSTLLDLLTGRRTVGRCKGNIAFRGASIANQQEAYIRNAGYMRQSNTGYLAGLSVLDNLVYAAMIRMQGNLEDKLSRVQTVMEETDLVPVQKTVASGLSGGQKRRLMLGLELLGDRHLLFLDEPTSGMDATAALELATILKRLSRNVTIIVAIHQPRPEIWQLFSHTILVKSGRVVYCGPAADALNGLDRYLPRKTKAELIDDQAASDESSVGVVSIADMDNATTSSCSSGAENVCCRAQDKTRPLHKRPEFDATSSKTTGWFPWQERKSGGRTTVDKTFRIGRGVSVKVGAKLQTRVYAVPTSDTGLGVTRGSQRSVPDKILDMLVQLDPKHINHVRAQEINAGNRHNGSDVSEPTRQSETTDHEGKARTFGGHGTSRGMACVSVWKTAATLLARSAKSGYGMRLAGNLSILVGCTTLMAVAFRQANRDSEMLHLMASVLFSMVLPVLIVYQPLMIAYTWNEWSLTKTEIADGFYPPVCATARIVVDHLAVGVVVSFGVVGIMHSILWHRFIADLPSSGLAVHIQLSCGVTLIAWAMISLFDTLAISGQHISMAMSIAVTLTSVWFFFSGTVLLVSSIPFVLRALTYTSPHYWNTSFMLRVILDGLDMTANCEHNNPFYCATGFGDLVAERFDLHMRPNGLNILAVVLFVLAGFAVMVTTVEIKGRHRGILGGLG